MEKVSRSAQSNIRVLSARARALNARFGTRALPSLYFFTDPRRTPDPVAAARALPRGAAIVYRPFGAADRFAIARALRRLAWRRGLKLLIGDDAALARRARADGVHLSERSVARAPTLRRPHSRWLITAAAHTPRAIVRAALFGADAAFVSPLFETASHTAARPLGPRSGAAWAQHARLPVMALGGVDVRTAKRLRGPWAGIAAIGGLMA